MPAFSLRWEHRTKLLRSTQSRPPSPAFPTPEQPESLAVPADQRSGLTMTKASLQLNMRERTSRAALAESVSRRGLISCS